MIVTKVYKRFLEKKLNPKKSEKGKRVHKGFFNELIRVNLSRNKKKNIENSKFSVVKIISFILSIAFRISANLTLLPFLVPSIDAQ